jgi:hypothetical protein
MKHKLSTTLSLVVLTVAITAATARAQTVANGPYYAPPSWDQTLPVATRFIVLSNFASAAVLDRETGLVWERSPDTVSRSWASSNNRCIFLTTGNRRGWRLPAFQELASLADASIVPFPLLNLPAGHPFFNVTSSDFFWSATVDADAPATAAWLMRFTADAGTTGAKSGTFGRAWCVRGGQGSEAQ